VVKPVPGGGFFIEETVQPFVLKRGEEGKKSYGGGHNVWTQRGKKKKGEKVFVWRGKIDFHTSTLSFYPEKKKKKKHQEFFPLHKGGIARRKRKTPWDMEASNWSCRKRSGGKKQALCPKKKKSKGGSTPKASVLKRKKKEKKKKGERKKEWQWEGKGF